MSDTNNKNLIWGCMLTLSNHMWNDEFSKPMLYFPQDLEYGENINTEPEVWDAVMPFLAERQFNLVLIDVGDGIKFDSHPEISAPNAWSKEYVSKKLAQMRAMGLEPIPKLNFSAGHDTWMKKYRRMVSSPEYYAFCADIIKEVCEIFGYPRLFHLGFDEETSEAQWNYEIAITRGAELWWHDLYFMCDQCEKYGARPWVWSDYVWNHEDLFLKKMPKSVVQSNWYYGNFRNFDLLDKIDRRDKRIVECYELLDKHGYDQIPTGSLYGWKNNLMQTLIYGKETLNPEHLLGYLDAPWVSTNSSGLYSIYNDADSLYLARKYAYPETLN
ncbi:MAG: Tat pathway signal protein [Clostridia bacterium]|nr:Tat pathway signal protein [Clostridia bacterium]